MRMRRYFALLLLTLIISLTGSLWGQTAGGADPMAAPAGGGPAPAGGEGVVPGAQPQGQQPVAPNDDDLKTTDDGVSECGQSCCPTSTREKLVIAGAGLVWVALIFVLLRTAMVAALIRKGWDPTLASHTAISTTLGLGAIGTAGISFIVHDCWYSGFNLLVGTILVVWLLHLIFTVLAVRGR